MTTLKGSEKQVAWANEIRERILADITMENAKHILPLLRKETATAKATMETIKSKLTQDAQANNDMILGEVKAIINSETSAKTFIDNQSMIGFLNHILS